MCSNLQRLSRKMKKEAHKGLLFHSHSVPGRKPRKSLNLS